MVITAWDNNATPSNAALTDVTFNSISGNSNPAPYDGGGMGWNIRWGIWNTGDGTDVTNLQPGTINIPAAHLVITFSNANIPATPNAPSFDNNTTFYGSPNPPEITTTQNGSLILAIGMVDNIRVSNITSVQEPENGYSPITVQTYGITDNGAILMSAYKNNLDPDLQPIPGTEDPEPFRGNGGNVWVAQTIIIGGPGSNTSGGPNNAGQWGGGGGSGRENESVSGMAGSQGAARIMWGNSRQYPASATAGNAPIILDWTP
jgi:hypothetical protein